jgi:hypothetical protein
VALDQPALIGVGLAIGVAIGIAMNRGQDSENSGSK